MKLSPQAQYMLDEILKRIDRLESKMTVKNTPGKRVVPDKPVSEIVPPVDNRELPKPGEVSMMIKTRLGGL